MINLQLSTFTSWIAAGRAKFNNAFVTWPENDGDLHPLNIQWTDPLLLRRRVSYPFML